MVEMNSVREPIDGVECMKEFKNLKVVMTVELKIFDEGKFIPLPKNLGIYEECSYWIHTHDDPERFYVEAPIEKIFKLRNFFRIWGVDISKEAFMGKKVSIDKPLYVYVNGNRYNGDPGDIVLEDGLEIIISYGKNVIDK